MFFFCFNTTSNSQLEYTRNDERAEFGVVLRVRGNYQNGRKQNNFSNLKKKQRAEPSIVYCNRKETTRDYEDEIKDYGDTVKMNSIGAVTISDYMKNG